MAFKMNRPLKMTGAKKSGLKLGRMRNAEMKNQIGQELSGDTDSTFYYNSKMGPMKMHSPSALKQMEEEMPVDPDAPGTLGEPGFEPPVEGEGGGGKNISLLPSEMEGTYVYEGTNINERINDYEDRLSFIEEDVWNEQEEYTDNVDMSQGTPQQQKDHATLTAEVDKLYKSKGIE